MSRSSFRRFEFFDVDTLSENITDQLGCEPTCVAAEGGMLIFGDEDGNLIISDKNFKVSEQKYRVFRGGEVIGVFVVYDHANQHRQYIIAAGSDNPPGAPPLYTVKIFHASDLSRSIYTINVTVPDAVLTSCAVLSDGSQIAVGYSNGLINLYSGSFLRAAAMGTSHQQRAPTPVALLARHPFPVSALYFCEVAVTARTNPSASTAAGRSSGADSGTTTSAYDRRIRMFAAMDTSAADEGGGEPRKPPEPSITGDNPEDAGILVFDTSMTVNALTGAVVAAPRHPAKNLDERGARSKCVSFMRASSELVVARSEAVYTYSIEDRGGALAVPGDKLSLCAVSRYALIVSVEDRAATATASQHMDGAAGSLGGAPFSSKPKKPVVNVYDLKSKIICGTSKKFQLPMGERVHFTVSDGGLAYLITSSWSLVRFREKSTSRKLDVLLAQNSPPLYAQAITLAAEEQLEPVEIMKLYKMYADHLYAEGDFSGAIQQYSYTIGYIPASYVIIKFLDPYRIYDLITYLEKLHEKGLSGGDHITLLLGCYTKVKDDDKLNKLLESIHAGAAAEMSSSSSSKKSSGFVPSQAIAMLLSSGHTAHALKIAARYQDHSAYINIQMKKTPPLYDDVLGYLAHMPFVAPVEAMLPLLHAHGRALLQARPAVFTALLIKLCTADFVALLPPSHPSALKAGATSAAAASAAASSSGASSGNASTGVWAGNGQVGAMGTAEICRAFRHLLPQDVTIPTQALPCEAVMSLLVDHDRHLLLLLQSVFESPMTGRNMPPKAAMALVELHLQRYSAHHDRLTALEGGTGDDDDNDDAESGAADNRAELKAVEASMQATETIVMGVLDGAHIHYDPTHALLLCHAYHFQRGERFLLERQQSVELLMRVLIERHDVREVFKLLRREGAKDPELYAQVLTYFVQQSIADDMDGRKDGRGAAAASGKGTGREHSHDSEEEEEEEDDDDEEEEEEEKEDKWDNIIDVMDLIEKEGALSPLQVLSILAINPKLPLHVASHFITNHLRSASEELASAEVEVQASMTNLETLTRTQTTEIQQGGFNSKAARQHERALMRKKLRGGGEYDDDDDDDDDEDDDENDETDRQNEERRTEYWQSLRRSMRECSANHEAFFKSLEHSTDGFSTVVEHFGRSIIS